MSDGVKEETCTAGASTWGIPAVKKQNKKTKKIENSLAEKLGWVMLM